MLDHQLWVTSRAAGLAALVFVSASVGVGLLLSRRLGSGRGAGLRVVHEALSLAALAMIALHVATLFSDSYFHASVADVAIPFVRNYREPYMAIGIIGGWATIALSVSYYARTALGTTRWRAAHRFVLVAWVMSVIHTLGEGTDSGSAWFLTAVAVGLAPAALFALMRVGRSRGPLRELERATREALRAPGGRAP